MSQDMLQKPSALGVEIPTSTESALMMGMKLSAKERFQAMKAFARAFGQAQAATPEKKKGGNGGTIALIIVGCVLIIGLAVAAFILFGQMSAKEAASDNNQTEATTEASSESTTETTKNEEAYGGYNSLKDAVEQIKTLEKQLDQAQSTNATYAEQIDTLKTEVQRLKTFEDNQVEFQKIKEQFYEEVVYAENGPGADEYRQYYEEMDPTTAEALYKQVIQTEAADKQMQEYANTFSNMQASEAAAILGNMTDNLDLAASILKNLDVSTRGAILGAMDSAIAARIVKIMDPNS